MAHRCIDKDTCKNSGFDFLHSNGSTKHPNIGLKDTGMLEMQYDDAIDSGEEE